MILISFIIVYRLFVCIWGYIFKINVSNKTTSQLVTGLTPFTFYLFTIESCNSIGCASSNSDNQSRVQTLPDIPEHLLPLSLNSKTSYSIEIEWNAPLNPNGVIDHYILERKDYAAPLSTLINNNNNNNMNGTGLIGKSFRTKLKRFQLESDKRSYVDNDDLEPCGVYSYRLLAFNQVCNDFLYTITQSI